jgi:hypothetical protein
MALRQAYPAADAGRRRGCNSINPPHLTRVRRLLAAAVLFGTAVCSAPSQAQSGPFAGLAGTWRGGGTVGLDDGSTERIRCRAHYAVSGRSMDLTLTCASDAYRFELQGQLVADGSAISGTWTESSRGVSGVLQGRGGGGNFQLAAAAAGFNANIALATRGNKQSVSIRADSQFRGANISLSR